MKYSEKELLEYAKARVHFLSIQKGKRAILVFMYFGSTIAALLWLSYIRDKFEFEDYGFILEKHFLAGILFAIGGLFWLIVGIIGGLRMFEGFYGKEMESLKLLIEMIEKKE